MQPKLIVAVFALLLTLVTSHSQVNLQTGSAVFSLPVFNWQDDKSRLNSIVALSYNSGNGLKVNDVASNVGQGWSLVAGGVITRMQVGEPDDQYPYNGINPTLQEKDITKYPAGILYASVPAGNGCPEALRKYPIYSSKNQVYKSHNIIEEDKELDYFSFQFNGKAGMFVLDPTNIGSCHSIGDTKMIITFQVDANLESQGIRTRIKSFTIRDVDGLIYKFSKHGLTKVLDAKYCDKSFSREITQPKFESGGVYFQSSFENPLLVRPWIINSWYLEEIEDVLTQRKIYFNYEARTSTNVASRDITYNLDGAYSFGGNPGYAIIAQRISKEQGWTISGISYPDGHAVSFGYGNMRVDLNGEKVLSSINITYNGRYLSKHILNTTYFILNRYGTPVTDYQKSVARLCLKSVQKIGVDLKEDTPPYIFDYYLGSNAADDFVPPPLFYVKDIWGFYNGNNSVDYHNVPIPLNTSANQLNVYQAKGLCFRNQNVSGVFLNSKLGYAKNGLLRQIIYPTGGTLTYEYEQNYGVIVQNGPEVMVGGVHVSKTLSTDGGFSNGCNNPISTRYDYVMNGIGSASSLWGLEMPENSMAMTTHYAPEHKKWHWTLSNFLYGECYWVYLYPGILSAQEAIGLTGFQQAMEVLGPVLNVLSILSFIKDVATLLATTAPGPGTIIAVVVEIIVQIITLAVTCIGDQARDNNITSYYNYALNNVSPLPTQFKRVEIVENPGTIGKTIQEFTSSDQYSIWELTNQYYSAKQRFAPWAYGLPLKTMVLNSAGTKIKETENIYNYTYAKSLLNDCGGHPGLPPCNPSGINSTLVSCKCLVVKTTSQRSSDWKEPNIYNANYHTSSTDNIKVAFYGIYTGRTQLTTTHERIYKVSNPSDFVQSTTNYIYNSYQHYEPTIISTTSSDGEIKTKYIKYSSDYNTGILATLTQNNILTMPVTTSSSVYKSIPPNSVQEYYLHEAVTEFTTLSNGDIKPYRIIEQRFDKPKPTYNPGGSTYIPYYGPGNPSNPTYKEIQILTYDAVGNLTTLMDEADRIVSNIYGYSDKYVIASMINADLVPDKCAYAGFETNALWSGWTQQGTPSYNTSSAITGNTSFILSASTSFSSPLNTGKPYTLSFWASNASTQVYVSGGTASLLKSAPILNGFTYYEYSISQGASSVTVSGGNANLDELRLYPQNARMRTVTYDPLIGKTSECDENNRITYYEYDNLGRLRFVKDEKGNIVKMNEYNNVSPVKQNGCPGVYYNRYLSETFTKECSAGYIGSTVTYSIAANTYVSTISQADADAQAENFLQLNGQAYANSNGTCIQIYYNTQQSQNFTTEGCPEGQIGGTVTYTVPANTYSSTISVADANQLALAEIEANGQAYANDPANAICNIDTYPHWVWEEGAATQCQNVNGVMHLFLWATDMNPNSSTYGQSAWKDSGPNPTACPSTCNSSNCTGEGYKCVYGVCELGIKVVTNSVQIGPHLWECTYHYEWSDGSWSQNYVEQSPFPCMYSY